jgi:succinate dehydrogenase/fumarate reductase-like Fe-S protein
MRNFRDGDTITIEPFRADAFPVQRDVVVDRTAFDRIVQAGGFISERSGSAPDANSVPISKTIADKAMDAAACIGCGACAAACPNGSAMLFVSAKLTHLGLLPKASRKPTDAFSAWSAKWTRRASATAQTTTPAKPSVPLVFPLPLSAA